MKNFTLRENVSHLENGKKLEGVIASPKMETLNAIMAYSKSLKVENSELLKMSIRINMN